MRNQTKGKMTNSKSSSDTMPARNNKKSERSNSSHSKQRSSKSERPFDGV